MRSSIWFGSRRFRQLGGSWAGVERGGRRGAQGPPAGQGVHDFLIPNSRVPLVQMLPVGRRSWAHSVWCTMDGLDFRFSSPGLDFRKFGWPGAGTAGVLRTHNFPTLCR